MENQEPDAYQETFATWNKMADLYQEKFMDLALYNASYDFFCEDLPQNARVLDVGCGPGNITKYLLTKRPDLQIHGIDVAPNMVQLAQVNNPSATFQVVDCRRLSSLAGSFDGIVCGFFLPYLSQAETTAFLADASARLSPNGILYLSFVEGNAADSGYKTGSNGNRVYFYYHGLEQLRSELQANALEELTLFKVDYPGPNQTSQTHTILVAKKKSV
ncbi:trans-aconitate 2-methyltransferase [Rufibacter sp. LB8]|uniref:class I SAM-dependent methyltransferase n=1 Tax=Rufibacter sp. LB8 TaxID=2777781 RepID=UPI00178C7F55|nr:class I SAM-dependent methyltransferase [Rufibacter sp. LB8]